MPNKLIDEGKQLKLIEYEVMGIKKKKYEGVEFERWTSNVSLFFEEQPDSPVKEKLLNRYAGLNKNNSTEFYNLALGALQAIDEQ